MSRSVSVLDFELSAIYNFTYVQMYTMYIAYIVSLLCSFGRFSFFFFVLSIYCFLLLIFKLFHWKVCMDVCGKWEVGRGIWFFLLFGLQRHMTGSWLCTFSSFFFFIRRSSQSVGNAFYFNLTRCATNTESTKTWNSFTMHKQRVFVIRLYFFQHSSK